MRKFSILLLIVCFFLVYTSSINIVQAKTLNENISEQLEQLNIKELENYLNDISKNNLNYSFKDVLSLIIRGDYSQFFSFKNYFLSLISTNIHKYMPSMIIIVAISILVCIIHGYKGSFASEGVSKIISFVSLLTIILLLFNSFISIFQNTKNTIETLVKTCEIMSPIIATLMVATGGTVTASLYKPTTLIYTNLSINVFCSTVLPILGLILVLGIISRFSSEIKLLGVIDFLFSIVKWVIGIAITCYGLFVSIQGITSSVFDGVSIKAAKYAIGNSIPIVGGFLKDGFDLVVASSIIIKNSIGFSCILILFAYVLAPFFETLVLMLLLKFVGGITNIFSDTEVFGLCSFLSKTLTYLNAILLLTGFMTFINVFIAILSSTAFV